jgi:hypothetical protein
MAGTRIAYNDPESSLLDVLKLLQDGDTQIAEYQYEL